MAKILCLALVFFTISESASGVSGATLPQDFALKITPDHGSMLGGDIITIQGPLFQPNINIQIKIGEYRVTCISLNNTHAICRTPMMYGRGQVTAVYVSNENQHYVGGYFIEDPLTSEPNAWIENSNDYNELSRYDITIRYDPSKLNPLSDTEVYLQLWGYKETRQGIQWAILYSTRFRTRDGPALKMEYNSITVNYYISTFKMGVFKVFSPNDNLFLPYLWTHPVPLGWLFNRYWTDTYKPLNWPQEMCQQWAFEDSVNGDAFQELPCCPRTISAIQEESNTFVHDDECNTHYKNATCYSFSRLLTCYVSKQTTKRGAGQQCCYDKMGQLTLEGDANRKTTYPCRSHPFGSYSYDVIYRVPGLSHWYYDFIPYLMCCKWTNECETYKQRRPPKRCETPA